MGATGQPGRTGGRDGGGPRPWWGDHRTTVFTVFGTVAGICTAGMGIVDRQGQIVLLVIAVALFLLGLAALVRVRTYVRWSTVAWEWSRRRRIVLLPLVAVVLAGATFVVLGLQRERSCEDPTEVAVAVPEDGAAGFAAAADAFERDSVNAFGCPGHHVTTFGVGWPTLRTALVSGWAEAPDGQRDSSLDLGPRPDVWIAESGAQADIVAQESTGGAVTVAGRALVAGSPLVLAVPEPYADALRATTSTGDSVRELVDAAGAAGLDVVRANPDTSFAAALHTVGLYDAEPDARPLELDLGRSLERAGLPFGSDGALLCRLDELSVTEPPRVAVLTSERAVLDGGTDCPVPGAGGSRAALVPFYPGSAVGLDYTAVRLSWAGTPAGRRADGAQTFVEWLGTAAGRAALGREAGVRGPEGQPPSGLVDAPVVVPGTNLLAYTRVLSAEERYRTARRPVRVLVLVDASASMDRPADGERMRDDVAERGVLDALGHLSGADEVGIWAFSGAPASSPRPVLGLTRNPEARNAAPEALAGVEPGGATPLYDAIDAGTSRLASLDPAGASRRHLSALVVLTDGEDRPGTGPGAELTVQDLVASAESAAASGVRVYAVAVGEASCQASDLRQITTAWGGECWDSSFGELEDTLDSLFGQLGGR